MSAIYTDAVIDFGDAIINGSGREPPVPRLGGALHQIDVFGLKNYAQNLDP
jgi:hypothetical protein